MSETDDGLLEDLNIDGLSRISTRYAMAVVGNPAIRILVVSFRGHYPSGSAGLHDAMYMQAMTAAGLAAWTPLAVVFDMSELDYEWGNDLFRAFTIAGTRDVSKFADAKDSVYPTAVVVGPRSSPGLGGVDNARRIGGPPPRCSSVKQALDVLVEQIHDART